MGTAPVRRDGHPQTLTPSAQRVNRLDPGTSPTTEKKEIDMNDIQWWVWLIIALVIVALVAGAVAASRAASRRRAE